MASIDLWLIPKLSPTGSIPLAEKKTEGFYTYLKAWSLHPFETAVQL